MKKITASTLFLATIVACAATVWAVDKKANSDQADSGALQSRLAFSTKGITEPDSEGLSLNLQPLQKQRYRIGVLLSPVDPIVRTQLGLKDEQGATVQQVLPDSPAAKSGIKQFDIIIKANDKPIGDPTDLIEVVKKAEGKTIKLDVLREAKKQTIEVTPELMGEPPVLAPLGDTEPTPRGLRVPRLNLDDEPLMSMPLDFEAIQRQMREQMQRLQQRNGFRAMPGMNRFSFEHSHGAPTGSLSISISRVNDGPAEIRVEKDGTVYETTEDDLDKLPQDIQEQIRPLLDSQQPVQPELKDELDLGEPIDLK